MAIWASEKRNKPAKRFRIVDVDTNELRYYYKGKKRKKCEFDTLEEALKSFALCLFHLEMSDIGNLELQENGKTIACIVRHRSDWEFFRVRFKTDRARTLELLKLIKEKKFRVTHMFS